MADNDNRSDAPAGDDFANDDDLPEASVFIIIGQVSRETDGEKIQVHVMLAAPDEDSAVRETLNALAREVVGFCDRIDAGKSARPFKLAPAGRKGPAPAGQRVN